MLSIQHALNLCSSLSIGSFNSAPNLPSLGYPADGEADDWLLHEHHVLSMSPEIGWDQGGFWQDYRPRRSSASNITRRRGGGDGEQGEVNNSEKWFQILELNYARIATVGFKAGAELNLSLLLSQADFLPLGVTREGAGGGQAEEEEGRREEGSLHRKGSHDRMTKTFAQGRSLRASEDTRLRGGGRKVGLSEGETNNRDLKFVGGVDDRSAADREEKKKEVQKKTGRSEEEAYLDDLVPSEQQQFVRSILSKGKEEEEEGGGESERRRGLEEQAKVRTHTNERRGRA